METATNQSAIYSEFDSDPDMHELVEMFVEEMPERVGTIANLLAEGDFESLRYSAHQLKGAVGSYGFHQLTAYAAKVESLLDEKQGEQEICAAVHELIEQCQRARVGQGN